MRPQENSCVVDASAILAVLLSEPGADRAAEHLATGAISSVNIAEVATKLSERGVAPLAIQSSVSRLGLAVIPLDDVLALQAGFLRTSTRQFGLSLGDRACLAPARQLRLPVITADRKWKDLDAGVEVLVIR